MLFKICGLKKKDSVICCEEHKVDFFGMIFYKKSPRNISLEEAKKLVVFSKSLKIKPVGVFVNHNIADLKKIISYLDLTFIQLHGLENQAYINEIKKKSHLKIIKKISVKSENDLRLINTFNNIDYLLFDYKPQTNELPGGNSKTFDWNLLNSQKIDIPWFVSGGINESSIKNIQKLINPHGIDLSSGVEEFSGIKSNQKIDKLFKSFYGN